MLPPPYGNHDDPFEGHAGAEFFKRRQQYVVNDQEPVLSVINDGRELVRVQAQVQRVKDSARARHAEERFEMAGMIPHHGSDAVARSQAKFGHRIGKSPRASVESAVGASAAMERSGLRETISTRWKSFPARSRIAGSVSGKSIMVPRMKIPLPSQFGGILPLFAHRRCLNRYRIEHWTSKEPLQKDGVCRERAGASDSFPLQKGLIFETMPLTAEVPVSLPAVARLSRLPVNDSCSSARSATLTWVPGRRSGR